MKHFAIEQWVDFSRDLIEQKDRSQMQEHLTAGCNACPQNGGRPKEKKAMLPKG